MFSNLKMLCIFLSKLQKFDTRQTKQILFR